MQGEWAGVWVLGWTCANLNNLQVPFVFGCVGRGGGVAGWQLVLLCLLHENAGSAAHGRHETLLSLVSPAPKEMDLLNSPTSSLVQRPPSGLDRRSSTSQVEDGGGEGQGHVSGLSQELSKVTHDS